MKDMKKTIKEIFLLLLALGIFTIWSFPEDTITIRKYYLPKEDDPFFKKGNDIEIIDNQILILENIRHHILIYTINNNDELEFKGFFATKGEGPGDILHPVEITIWEDKVAIIEHNGISFFSNKGKFLNKFRIFTGYISVVYAADKIYYANTNQNNQSLIDVYSTEGKKLFQFGENLIDINYDVHHKKVSRDFVNGVFYKGKLISDGKLIYYLNQIFGKIFVFDLKGKKIKEKSIVPFFDKKFSQENLDKSKNLLEKGIKPDKYNQLRVVISSFFKDVYLCNDQIYILNSRYESFTNTNIKIRVIDKNSLELVNTIIIKKTSDEDWISSIAVQEVSGEPVIFAAMNTKEGSVLAKFME